MSTIELITLVSCLLGMVATIGSLIKPIINLNTAITKLNDSMTALQGDMMSYKNDAKTFSTAIFDLTNKATLFEEQIKVINKRILDLENETKK